MSLEDKMKILQVVAIGRIFNNQFEIDELIDVAWLRASVREAVSASQLFMAAKFAMIDYIRVQRGRPYYWDPRLHKKILKPTRKYTTSFCSLQNENEFSKALFNNIAFQEDLKNLLKGCTRTQKLVAKMRFSGFSRKEIGKIIPCSITRVDQIWTELKEILKEKYNKEALR